MLPNRLAYAFGLMLIPVEIFLAVAFAIGLWLDVTVGLAAVVLALFLIAVGTNLMRHRKISCGCFGNSGEQISLRTLSRLLMLVVVALAQTAFESIVGIPLLSVHSLSMDEATLGFLLQSLFLALFSMAMAGWVLNLPELIPAVRNYHRIQDSSRAALDANQPGGE